MTTGPMLHLVTTWPRPLKNESARWAARWHGLTHGTLTYT